MINYLTPGGREIGRAWRSLRVGPIVASREAAQECSPRRQPWLVLSGRQSPEGATETSPKNISLLFTPTWKSGPSRAALRTNETGFSPVGRREDSTGAKAQVNSPLTRG